MQARYLIAVILIVAGAASAWWFVRTTPADPDVAADAPDATQPPTTVPSEPALHGAGADAPRDGVETDPLARLVKQAASADSDARHTAFRKLKALYEDGKVPLERLVNWALRVEAGGNGELVQWALSELSNRKPDILEYLPRILAHAHGASKQSQDAVTAVLRKLAEIRGEDVALETLLGQLERALHQQS